MAGPKRFRLLLSTGNTFASPKAGSAHNNRASQMVVEVLESFELLLRNHRLGGDYYPRNNHQQLEDGDETINIDMTITS